jgi:hypothetical protein
MSFQDSKVFYWIPFTRTNAIWPPTFWPALVSVMNNVGSAALTNCRHWSTLRGPQYKQSQRLHRVRTTSPVSWLMKTWRSAQGFGQKSKISRWYFSARLICSSNEGRGKRATSAEAFATYDNVRFPFSHKKCDLFTLLTLSSRLN